MSKPHKPGVISARKTVEQLVLLGATQIEIAAFLGIDPKTLRKRYREVLDKAQQERLAEVAKHVYDLALDKNPHIALKASVFLLTTKRPNEWALKQRLEHSGQLTLRTAEDLFKGAARDLSAAQETPGLPEAPPAEEQT